VSATLAPPGQQQRGNLGLDPSAPSLAAGVGQGTGQGVYGAAVGALRVVPGATRKASCESFVVVVAQRRPDSGPVAPVEAADQCPVLGGFGTTSAVRS